MKKCYIKTESREITLSSAEVQKIIFDYLKEEHMMYMGSDTQFFIDHAKGVVITTVDSKTKED